jgi:hypothetical protein
MVVIITYTIHGDHIKNINTNLLLSLTIYIYNI